MIRKETIYFEAPGETNTNECLQVVKREVEQEGYKYVVVASSTGKSGALFAEALQGLDVNLSVITHGIDGAKPDDAARQKILNLGAAYFNAPDISFYVNHGLGEKYASVNAFEIVEKTLDRFGKGLAVGIKCAMAAVDGGLVHEGLEVLVVSGTNAGADTVAVLRVMSSKRFQELRVREVLAKPRD